MSRYGEFVEFVIEQISFIGGLRVRAMFGGEELLNFINQADFVTANDYEAQLLQEKTGKKIEELAKLVKALVVTLGACGSLIYAGGKRIEIPCVKAEAMVDPTGCGDAYRAGLLYGIAQGMDWETIGRSLR